MRNNIGLLYCSKELTDIFLNQYMRNGLISHNQLHVFTKEKKAKIRRIKDIQKYEDGEFDFLPNLTELEFGTYYDQPLNSIILPRGLKKLKFDRFGDFNQSLEPQIFPDGLKYLSFGFCFNKPLINPLCESLRIDHKILPNSLIELEFGYNFNQSLNDPGAQETNSKCPSVLPGSLQKLILGFKFNQPLYALPETLIHLSTGQSFNHPIDQKLPMGLETLDLGHNFIR